MKNYIFFKYPPTPCPLFSLPFLFLLLIDFLSRVPPSPWPQAMNAASMQSDQTHGKVASHPHLSASHVQHTPPPTMGTPGATMGTPGAAMGTPGADMGMMGLPINMSAPSHHMQGKPAVKVLHHTHFFLTFLMCTL